ncbi:hypothetical protein [Agrobacterium burrii]
MKNKYLNLCLKEPQILPQEPYGDLVAGLPFLRQGGLFQGTGNCSSRPAGEVPRGELIGKLNIKRNIFGNKAGTFGPEQTSVHKTRPPCPSYAQNQQQ